MAADVIFSNRVLSFYIALFFLFSNTHAFYIPGWSIKTFSDGDPIPLYHNKIFSDSSSLQYAYSTLPFICPPNGKRHPGAGLVSGSSITLNLGEVLRGDRITISDYMLRMGEDMEFEQLCMHTVSRKDVYWAQDLVKEQYMVDWIVDNLPGATSFVTTDKSRKYYAAGFRFGWMDIDQYDMQPRYYINNHVTLVIRYKMAPGKAGQSGKKVIVGFEVYPKSIEAGHRNATGYPQDINDISGAMELALSYNETYKDGTYEQKEFDTLDIPFSYSVYYREDENEGLRWGNRWDMYFVADEDTRSVHWLAIINSLVISGFLTALVAVIFTRTIRGDIKGYMENGLEEGKMKIKRPIRKSLDKTAGLLDPVENDDIDTSEDDEALEDITGWKLVHGDVFRTPSYGPLLAPLVGSGMQLVFMASGLLLLSCIGLLNPSFRGGYVSVGLALFIIAGLLSGYFSARIYKTFGGQLWQHNIIVTASLVPGLLFAIFFILNLFVWAQASSNAIPFGTLIALLFLWLLVQLPLVFVGAWIGHHKHGAWDHPVRPTMIARQVPPQPWYLKKPQVVLFSGLVPFLIILIELMYVFKSLWLDKSGFYYMFGFLAFVGLILMIVVMEVTILVVYLQLCAENYNWQWSSFLIGSSSSLWIFAYCVWYFHSKLHITSLSSTLLFFAYSGLACAVYGLLTGTIGFLAAYAFVRRIYFAIKVD